MFTTVRRLQGLAVIATILGACSAPLPMAGPGTFSTQGSESAAPDQAVTPDAGAQKRQPRKGQPKPSKPRPQPSARAPKPTRPSPRPTRYPSPAPTQHPDHRYYPPNPDDRYNSPNDDYRRGLSPVISRVWTDDVGPNQVTVNWTTDRPAYGMVAWGTGPNQERSSWLYPLDTFHSYTLENLEPGTAYSYRVYVRTDGGRTATSPVMTVETTAEQ